MMDRDCKQHHSPAEEALWEGTVLGWQMGLANAGKD
jgi:hypothetical protein